MKKRIEKKLSLSKETLRNLSNRELEFAVGGGPTLRTQCCDGTSSSCTYDSCVTCTCTCQWTNGC